MAVFNKDSSYLEVDEDICDKNSQYFSFLTSMGYDELRVRKALIETDFKGIQSAYQWLQCHSNDSKIYDINYHDFILYLCPTGDVLDAVTEFLAASRKLCGWRDVHNYLPHISLTSFFQVSDCDAPNIIKTFGEMRLDNYFFYELIKHLRIETYVSPHYMGCYISKAYVPEVRRFIKEFMGKATTQGAKFKEGEKKLHLPLAYHFRPDEFEALSQLVNQYIGPHRSEGTWELRLYSRDPRVAGKEVYKVLHPSSPNQDTQLEIKYGDYVYMDENSFDSIEGDWVSGTSWLTGLTGLVKKCFLERTACTDLWISHLNSQNSQQDCSIASSALPFLFGNLLHNKNKMRDIYIMRHGERIDFTFKDWTLSSFDEKGNYIRKDLNMPKTLPKRNGAPLNYEKDCPLTNVGEIQAHVIGEAMKDSGVKIAYVLVSPSYRCIQTAYNVLKGLGLHENIPLSIEPGLFEWTGWHSDYLPNFFTPKELSDNGFLIDADYSPVIQYEDLSKKPESFDEYYFRSHKVMKSILDKTDGENVLIVGHAATLETCSRQLTGKQPRKFEDLIQILPSIAYCSVICLRNCETGWKIIEPPFPPFTHSRNQKFDYKVLKD